MDKNFRKNLQGKITFYLSEVDTVYSIILQMRLIFIHQKQKGGSNDSWNVLPPP
jgi:hypothetical protein